MDRGSKIRRVRDRAASQRYSMIYSTNGSGYYDQPSYNQTLPMFYTAPGSDFRELQVNRHRPLRNQTLFMTNRYRRSLQPQPSLRSSSLHNFADLDGDLSDAEGDGGAVSDGQRDRMGTSEHISLPELGEVNDGEKTGFDMEYEERIRNGNKYRATASIVLRSASPAPSQHFTNFPNTVSCTESPMRHGYLAPPTNPVGLLQTVRNTQPYWFLNSIPPTEVRQRLETQPPGSFIVRQSNRWMDLFHLIFKSGPRTADIKRVDLRRTKNGFTIDNFSEGQYYPTMYHLIAAHCRQTTILPCLLRLPGYTTFSQRQKSSHNPVHWSPQTRQYTSDVRVNRLLSNSRHSSSSPAPERGQSSYQTAPLTQWCSGLDSDSHVNETKRHTQSAASLLPQGAACKLFYIGSYEITARTYMEAIKLCVDYVLGSGRSAVSLRVINFRVCGGGIIMNDLNKHQLFQQQYPAHTLLYIGLDPLYRKWKAERGRYEGLTNSRIFGFISRNPSYGAGPLQCHLLAENNQSEPAHVICDFTSRYFNLTKM
ncbi:unnamed protein product [Calicophoron daubneyi]|uniref:SH2 domain-containing protein n=1 Tax=Calicophoron daubneyi TaxID=300641 RepID=A0AAV2TVH3_CALDB